MTKTSRRKFREVQRNDSTILGLIPVYSDRNGPYAGFTQKEGEPPIFATPILETQKAIYLS